jgi:hypothetical protein
MHGSIGSDLLSLLTDMSSPNYCNNPLQMNVTDLERIVLYLSPQDDNDQTAYNVVASFDGDSASTATATMTTLDGTQYAVCTTIQYNNYKPSSNSTTITVRPQKTEGAMTLVGIQAMQERAEREGFKVWGEPTGICPPWYIIHIRIGLGSPNEYIQFGLSLFGLYVEQFSGIEALMSTYYERINASLMDMVVSAAISGMMTTALTFVAGLITTRLTKAIPIFGIPASQVAIAIYVAVLIMAFGVIAAGFDKITASTVLLTVGLSLACFCCRAVNLVRFVLPAPDYVQAAMKTVGNYYSNSYIKEGISTLMGVTTALDADFMIATGLLGGLAIIMAGILSI